MSQAKVDKRKYEKIHRKELERKRKIKVVATTIVTCIVIGALVGFPIGYRYYKSLPVFLSSEEVDDYIKGYVSDRLYFSGITLPGGEELDADSLIATENVVSEEDVTDESLDNSANE